MPQSLERILVVAFKYPPYSAVGGKRWAKLSKYLARQGTVVHVLTVPWPNESQQALQEVSDPRIRIHRIPALALNRLRVRNPRTRLGRTWNRAYRDHVHGRPRSQDAAMWGPAVIPAAAWLARIHNVQAMIVTGAPFMANYWIGRARPMLPRVPLIQEFRDPWSDLPEEALPAQGGRDKVTMLECRVIESADTIVTVTAGLSDLIQAKAGATPVHTITNGYDPEDLPLASPPRPRPFRLIHGGNLFVGRQAPLRSFLDVVIELADEMPGLELVFRGIFPGEVRNEYTHLEEAGILKVLPPIPGPDFMRELDDSFAALQFNSEHFPYLVSTKIYEYGAARRPVFSVNYGGAIECLIRDHRLGWNANARRPAAIADGLRALHAEWLRNPTFSTEPAGLEQYAYDRIACDYRRFIETLL